VDSRNIVSVIVAAEYAGGSRNCSAKNITPKPIGRPTRDCAIASTQESATTLRVWHAGLMRRTSGAQDAAINLVALEVHERTGALHSHLDTRRRGGGSERSLGIIMAALRRIGKNAHIHAPLCGPRERIDYRPAAKASIGCACCEMKTADGPTATTEARQEAIRAERIGPAPMTKGFRRAYPGTGSQGEDICWRRTSDPLFPNSGWGDWNRCSSDGECELR
jgi:hypothetical protein